MAHIHHIDVAARLTEGAAEGERLGIQTVDRIRAGTSDRDLLMRAVLNAMSEDGRVLPPGPALRACCDALQAAIAGSAP